MAGENAFLRGWNQSEVLGNQRGAHQLAALSGLLNLQASMAQQQENALMNPLKRRLLEAQVNQATNPAPSRVDLGDRIGFVDNAGNLVGFIPKGATPDATMREAGADRRHLQPSGNTLYGGQVTMRGQDMVDQRAREEGAANRAVTTAGQNRPVFSPEAGGWVVPPVVGGVSGAPRFPQPQADQGYSPSVRGAFGMQIPPQVQAQRDAEAARIRAGEASGGAGMVPTSAVIPVPGLGQRNAPQGYRFTQSGNLEAIPGGPADTKIGEKAEQTRRREDASLSRADLVISKVDKALDQTGFFTTGLTGAMSGVVPGMPAYNYQKTLDTIIGNIGFQELQAMREASPTGGALGQVAVKELEMLQSVLSNLDKGQSESQQRENLMAVGRHFQNWKNAVRESRGLPPEPNKFDIQSQETQAKLRELNIPYEPNLYEYRITDGKVQRKKK